MCHIGWRSRVIESINLCRYPNDWKRIYLTSNAIRDKTSHDIKWYLRWCKVPHWWGSNHDFRCSSDNEDNRWMPYLTVESSPSDLGWWLLNLCLLIFHYSPLDRIDICITHWGWDKWPPFARRHFQMHFLEWKYINFDGDFIEICSQLSNLQYSSISLDYGLAPVRRKP